MKGILFGGCSFTWGHGLWHYSDLDYTGYPKLEIIDINDAHIKYKNTISFPTLVANHFKTFSIVKELTGGSEDHTFEFFDSIFHNKNFDTYYSKERYSHNEVDCVVVQLSQVHRNKFYFELDGKIEYCVMWYSGGDYNADKLDKWLEKNNIDFDQCIDIHIDNQLDRLERRLKYYEAIGMKTRVVIWDHLYTKKLLKNDFLSSRLVKLAGKYDDINKLMGSEDCMVINNDYEHFINPPIDAHPSKKCHELIAESIIHSLESEIDYSEIKPRQLFESSKNNIILDIPKGLETKIMPEKFTL